MTEMISGMLTNDIDNWHLCPAGIVQISESVAKSRAKMKESACWFPGHARITICRSGDHAFEQTEHATHFGHSVKRSNDVDFRCARVAETGVNFPGKQRANQTFSAVHLYLSRYLSKP